MSGNPSKAARKNRVPRKGDGRVVRTRDVLGEALVELMQEKPFEQITVQHVLDRAGVSRSTFYTHYRDKDDLFMGDVDQFWEGMASFLSRRGDTSNRVAPVQELFAHVAGRQEFYASLVTSGKVHDVLELGQGHLARGIEHRLAELSPAGATGSLLGTARAQALAGALLSLMTWWMNHGRSSSPEQMDELYHQMVWSGDSTPAVGLLHKKKRSTP
jgi:AcrR family transcriptional regulator